MSIATTTRTPGPTITVARSAPRRRSVMQGALAALLIIVGALTAGYVAQRIGTTEHEITTRLSPRVERVFIQRTEEP